jgi:hypothetical protein
LRSAIGLALPGLREVGATIALIRSSMKDASLPYRRSASRGTHDGSEPCREQIEQSHAAAHRDRLRSNAFLPQRQLPL